MRVRCCWPDCLENRYGYLNVCQSHANHIWRYVEDEADESLRQAQIRQRRATAPKDHERHGWIYYLDVHGVLKDRVCQAPCGSAQGVSTGDGGTCQEARFHG